MKMSLDFFLGSLLKSCKCLEFCIFMSIRNLIVEGLSGNDELHYMYYVNDGVYGSFNCLLYDHAEVEPSLLEVRLYVMLLIAVDVGFWWIGDTLGTQT